jgi:hypothetical protein
LESWTHKETKRGFIACPLLQTTSVQDAQILARHSDIRLTLDIYTESWDEELNRAVDTLGEFLQKPSDESDEDETAS